MKEKHNIPLWQKETRVGLRMALSSVFPKDVYDMNYPFQEGTGIERLKELMRQGYGALFDITHFAYSDLPQSLSTLQFLDSDMINKKLLIGGAAHQIKPGVVPLGKITGVEILPIATRDTLKDLIEKERIHPLLFSMRGRQDL